MEPAHPPTKMHTNISTKKAEPQLQKFSTANPVLVMPDTIVNSDLRNISSISFSGFWKYKDNVVISVAAATIAANHLNSSSLNSSLWLLNSVLYMMAKFTAERNKNIVTVYSMYAELQCARRWYFVEKPPVDVGENAEKKASNVIVSYTHLTLPTVSSVEDPGDRRQRDKKAL